MTDRQMITTLAFNAMSGHGLTDARVIVMSDAELYPERQGQSATGRAVAYSVYHPATGRFSLVTLDGRWIIPGADGYKTRGPVKAYARKNIADVRPEGMRILEPVRHNGRYAMTRYGQRRSGICRGSVSNGQYGYSCGCGASLRWEDVNRDGWVVVYDGRRGSHTVSYALDRDHAVEYGTVPSEYAPPSVIGGPEIPASVKAAAPAPVEAPSEVPAPAPVEVTTADGRALPFGTYRPNVPGARTLRGARPLVIGGRTITAVVDSSGWTLFAGGEILATGDAREISGDACEWFAARAVAATAETARPGVVWKRAGNGAYGAKRHVVTVDGRWSFRVDVTGPDGNGLETFSAPLLLVAGRDKGVKAPTIQVADFQTYDRDACEADIQAWLNHEVRSRETRHAELHAAGKTPRPAEYRGVCGECRIKAPGKTRCDCTGGKTWAAGERDRADMARVFKATRKASDARAAGKAAPAGFFGWSAPTRTAEWKPEGYAPGVMLAWDVEGVAFTGQVWANDVITGEWSGSSYAGSADACVITATVDGVRATRDQAVAVPMWFGSKHGTPYARVSVPNGTDENGKARRFTADVTVIAAECASEGLFPVEAVEESAPEENGPESDAETSALVDPGYTLDVAEGERVFTRPGFADGGSYEGRAAVLRGVVTVADARAAVERFPLAVRAVGGTVVDGVLVPMGCAMLSARATVRTDAGYAVTLPDGTTVNGTWVECGNAFAEWAITQRPEFVCATAEGHADGAATLARIGAEVRAEREQAEAEAAQAAADLDTVAADLERVWSVWSPYLDDLTDEDEERVYGVDAGARTALRYARAAVERNDSGAVVHFVNEAREGVEWLAGSARRSGLDVPDAPAEVPAQVAAPVHALPDVDSVPDAIEAWEGEGGAVPGVATPPPAPEGEPSDGGATADAPEPVTSTELDTNTSNQGHTPGGKGGFSRELDADASKKPGEVAAAVAVMPIDWAKPAGRGDCAAANTCGGFGVLLWDVPGCAPRCAECAARIMGHSPSALHALTLPGDVVEAEEEAEAADIVIRHTHEDGTTVEGSAKGDGVWEALRPLGWTYRRNPGIFIRGSRYKGADRWKINRAADAVRALGLSCAVVIEETMSFAEREAARVDAAEERTERFADRAGRAAASSQSARDASDRIGDRFWMGQPILVGHHSEGRARRDQERMHNAMRKSIAEGERAGYWASRAAAADAYERYRKNPGRTLRRIEKLEAERRGVLRERDGVDDKGRTADVWRRPPSEARREELTRRLAEYDEELTYWAETIKEAERRGFKVWGRADFVKGDYVRYRGTWYEVTRVNAKSVTIPHIHAAFDGGAVGAVSGCRVVTRAAAQAAGRMGAYTYTAAYNDGVTGRMSAEQMRAALAGAPIPADPRDVTPEPTPEEIEAEQAADARELAERQDQAAPAPVAPAVTVSAPAPAGVSAPGTEEAWEGDGGAVPGVTVPRAVAQLREVDASTSNGDSAPGGEGGFSQELDADAPNGPVDGAALRDAYIAAHGNEDAMRAASWWCDTDCATCADGRECADCPTCTEFAHPYPARWARRPAEDGPDRMVHVCHGPGGMSEGQRLALGGDDSADVDAVGIEINEGAAATARAAGYTIICADVRTLDPRHPVLTAVKRLHLSTPCPTISTGGKRSGVQPAEVEKFMDLLFHASEYLGHLEVEDVCQDYGGPHEYAYQSDAENEGEAAWDPSGYDGEWEAWCEEHDDTADCDGCHHHIQTQHCMEGTAAPGGTPDEFRWLAMDACADERTALMAEVLLWPMAMIKAGGILATVTMEQSDNLLKAAAPLCAAIQTELRESLQFDWVSFQVEDAATYGAASHRVRTWMIAVRDGEPDGARSMVRADDVAAAERAMWGDGTRRPLPTTRPDLTTRVDLLGGRAPLPSLTVAQALGWESGLWVDTRGARPVDPVTGRAKGGGSFSADKVAQCVTATWYGATRRRADEPQGCASGGRAFTQAELGALVGFRWDYPWQHVGRGEGIRNKAQQAADAVSPFMGMAVTGAVLSRARRIWYRRALAYQRALYAYAVNLWTTEQRAAVENQLEAADAQRVADVNMPTVQTPPMLPAAPVRLRLERGPVRLHVPAPQTAAVYASREPGECGAPDVRAGRTMAARPRPRRPLAPAGATPATAPAPDPEPSPAVQGARSREPRSAAVAAPVGSPLSHRAETRGVGGVRAGHSARQGATRQGARQATRQSSGGWAGHSPKGGERGPPSPARPGPGRCRLPPNLTGAHQSKSAASRVSLFRELDACTSIRRIPAPRPRI